MLYHEAMTTTPTTTRPLNPSEQVLADSGLTGKEADAAAAEMMYIWNCTGGRPSDAMRLAVDYVRRGARLASPVASAIMDRD